MQRKRKYLLIIPLAFLLVLTSGCINQDKKRGKNKSTDKGDSFTDSVELIEILPLPIEEKKELVIDDYDAVFEMNGLIDEEPQFPGGRDALLAYIKFKMQYPEEAKDKGIAGRVICRIVILEDGTVSNVEVTRGVDPLLDAEAVRILESMPKWKPGAIQGRKVKVRFTVPVAFRLQTKDVQDLDPLTCDSVYFDKTGNIIYFRYSNNTNNWITLTNRTFEFKKNSEWKRVRYKGEDEKEFIEVGEDIGIPPGNYMFKIHLNIFEMDPTSNIYRIAQSYWVRTNKPRPPNLPFDMMFHEFTIPD